MNDALAAAIAKAARSGPVKIGVGVGYATGAIEASGGVLNTYWRVGAAPTNGSRVIVLRAGSLAVVFTGATRVIL